jgi:hypothetical protein
MKTSRRALILPLAALLAWGCQKQESKVDSSDIAGNYTLLTIDGHPLPHSPASHAATLVRSGVFTITPHGECGSTIQFDSPAGGSVTREVTATFTREGNRLHMKWKGAGRTIGEIQGDAFTMTNEGVVFGYKKEAPQP